MEENTQNVEKQSGKPSFVVIGAIGVAVVFVMLFVLWFAGRNDGDVQGAEGTAQVETGEEKDDATDVIVQEIVDSEELAGKKTGGNC